MAFWDEMARDPPEGVCALRPAKSFSKQSTPFSSPTSKTSDGLSNGNFDGAPTACSQNKGEKVYSPDKAMSERNRRPLPVLSEGQAVFWRYSGDMFHALLHFSLAGGRPASPNRLLPLLLTVGLCRLRITSHHVRSSRNWISDLFLTRCHISPFDGDDSSLGRFYERHDASYWARVEECYPSENAPLSGPHKDISKCVDFEEI